MLLTWFIISQKDNMVELSLLLQDQNKTETRGPKILVKNVQISFLLVTYYEHAHMMSIQLTNTNKLEQYGCVIKSRYLFKDSTRIFLCDDTDSRVLYNFYDADVPNLDLNIEVKPILEILGVPKISNNFSCLHEDTALTDFELRGEDGSVKVHSAVLAASSPVLRAMLEKQCKETKDRSYYIKDATRATLQHLKDYMYTFALPETGFEELLLLAHCYMMPELETECIKKLLGALSKENIMEMSKFAIGNGLDKFYLAIMSCVESGKVRIGDIDLQ